MKLVITIIFQMPGEMHAALNQFFTRSHENEVKLSQKIRAFLEKNNYIYVSTIVGLSKRDRGG